MTYVVQRGRGVVLAVCTVIALAGCEVGSDDEASADVTGQSSVTERLSDVMVDVAIATVGQLGQSVDSAAARPLLSFISDAGDEDAVRFRAAAAQVSRRQISEAMRDDDPGTVEVSLERAGRLEGMIVTAEIRHQLAATEGAEELTAAQRLQAAFELLASLGAGEQPQDGFLDGRTIDGPREDDQDDLRSAAANDRPSIERFTVVQAALDAGLIDADDLGRLAHTGRGSRVVLDPGLDAEELAEVYFGIDFDRGLYERGWETGFGGLA